MKIYEKKKTSNFLNYYYLHLFKIHGLFNKSSNYFKKYSFTCHDIKIILLLLLLVLVLLFEIFFSRNIIKQNIEKKKFIIVLIS